MVLDTQSLITTLVAEHRDDFIRGHAVTWAIPGLTDTADGYIVVESALKTTGFHVRANGDWLEISYPHLIRHPKMLVEVAARNRYEHSKYENTWVYRALTSATPALIHSIKMRADMDIRSNFNRLRTGFSALLSEVAWFDSFYIEERYKAGGLVVDSSFTNEQALESMILSVDTFYDCSAIRKRLDVRFPYTQWQIESDSI